MSALDETLKIALDADKEIAQLKALNAELLAALEAAANEMQIAWQKIELQGDKIRAGHMRIILSKIRAALAKARN